MGPDMDEVGGWMARQVNSADGDKIGRIDDIYLDDYTGRPEWLAVTTGWFGSKVSFVPLAEARSDGDDVVVPYSKDVVKEAPKAEHDGHLSPEDEEQLYRHYEIAYEPVAATGERTDAAGMDDDAERARDDAMTRSEEELQVGTTDRTVGAVRLRKWVDTEHVTRTVPVTHDEVRIEREPITEGNLDAATSGPEISEGEHTEVLHEEQVVTNTEVVPKERVRLEKERVTDEAEVSADLRKERVEVDEASGREGAR